MRTKSIMRQKKDEEDDEKAGEQESGSKFSTSIRLYG